MKFTEKWVCPKCETKNSYYVERIRNLCNSIIGHPRCKKCRLLRFSNEYYLLKGGKTNE